MADEPKKKAETKEPEEEPAVEVSVEGETNGGVVSIDGNEFELDAQELVALKQAVDKAVAGLTL